MTRLFLLRYIESYFRHRWLYLLPVLFTAVAAILYFYTLEPKYTTRGILYINNQSLLTSLTAVQNNDASWWVTPAQATNNEINELIQTDAFIRAVISDTDLEEDMNKGAESVYETISSVRRSIWTYPVGNNELSVNASYIDPQTSLQMVNAVMNSYIRWQVNTKRKDSQVAKQFFSDLIQRHGNELEAARQKLKDYYNANPDPIRGERPIGQKLDIERLQQEINLSASRYESALNKEEDANLAMTQIDSDVRHTYVLMDAPLLPDKPDTSKRMLAQQAAMFLAAGLLLSLIGIAGGTLLDNSFRYPIDVQAQLSLPVLAAIPGPPPRPAWYQRLWARIRYRRAQPDNDEADSIPAHAELAPDNRSSKEAEQRVDLTI
jgi:uncharacterized protein involved in exopolysaccharide biosynthesis